jgi:glycosyltransferase involved in cell wall biosynthesis
MRVTHVALECAGRASGASYSVPRTSRALRECGVDSVFVGLDWGDRARVVGNSDELAFSPSGPMRRLGASTDLRRWIHARAAGREVDVLHFHSVWMMPLLYATSASRRSLVPLVVSPHGTLSQWAFRSGSFVKRLTWYLTQRRALEHAVLFQASSEMERDEIRSMGFKQRIETIPHGIDIPPPIQRGHRERRTLLFLSRIHRKKGVHDLLAAWGALSGRFPDWQLRIVGPLDSDYALQMQKEAHHLPRVDFVGELAGQEKWEALASAEVFVLPTYSENFGIAVAEALASATPVVVSQGAPWGEVVNRNAGWWPEIGVEGLVATLSSAMALSREELAAMGSAGREWMIREYSWIHVAERLRDMYRSIR